MQPSLTDVKITWPVSCVQSPSVPPPIFNRSRLIVYSTSQGMITFSFIIYHINIFTNFTDPPRNAKLSAFADCKVSVSSELQAQQCKESGLVQLLAAKARIRFVIK